MLRQAQHERDTYSFTGTTLLAASLARALASSVSLPFASATPMRRFLNASGLPNRRMSDSGTRKASSTPLKGDALFIHLAVDHGARTCRAQAGIHRQAENGAGMQFEFVETLGAHGHHAGVVRTRTDFAEPDLVAFDEQFNAEDAQTAQIRR